MIEGMTPGTPMRYRRPVFWLCVFALGLGLVGAGVIDYVLKRAAMAGN
jgi:hypothetical protein